MTHVDKQLQAGEEILYRAHPSKIALVPIGLLALGIAIVTIVGSRGLELNNPEAGKAVLVVGGLLVLIAIGVIAVKLIVFSTYEYVLTNRRVIKQTGLLAKNSTSAQLEKLNNVDHRQSLWGRIFEYGDVEIDTASETGMTYFKSIADPLDFKKEILSATEAYRAMRSGHAPQVTGAEKIRQLKSLLDDGLISQEEFEEKRKKLLAEM